MDIYEQEVERLTKSPQNIEESWEYEKPLFKHIGEGDRTNRFEDGGCLTQIRKSEDFFAFIKGVRDEALEAEIRADERIPMYRNAITIESLPVFAEWQRKIDALQNA